MAKISDLDAVITDLTAAAIRTQMRLNAAHLHALNEFKSVVEGAPPEARDLLQPLTPSLEFVRNFEIEVTSEFDAERTLGFAIQARPLNLGYSILHSKKQSEQSSIRLFVEQVPVKAS